MSGLTKVPALARNSANHSALARDGSFSIALAIITWSSVGFRALDGLERREYHRRAQSGHNIFLYRSPVFLNGKEIPIRIASGTVAMAGMMVLYRSSSVALPA